MTRKRTSGAEHIMGTVAKLPWWGGLAMGFVGWLVFHRLAATAPAPSALQPGQMGVFLQRSMVASISHALQYAIPLLCVVAAGVSWLRRRKGAALVVSVTSSPAADALNTISWREFEIVVAEAFRLQGYSATGTGGATPDGGVDVVLRKGGESFLVQCKQWRAYRVGVDVVRELYGAMAAQGAAGGFVVTSGSFTREATAFAEGRNIKLIDGPQLTDMMRAAKAGGSIASSTCAARTPEAGDAADGLTVDPTPHCPSCNAPMVRRRARKGAGAGSEFWGCTRFPACRGTR